MQKTLNYPMKNQRYLKLIASILTEIKLQEKILSYYIRADGSMAHVWTPYQFYLNGKFSHKVVNALTLFKKDNSGISVWKILHLIDIRRN